MTLQRVGLFEKCGDTAPAVQPRLSIVVPFYNEAEGIPAFVEELRAVTVRLPETEILLVDDGSTDGTAEVLEAERRLWPELRVLRLERNCGQAAALYAGLRQTRAPLVGILDGDGQNPPGELPLLLARLEETGADVVAGVRARRNDSWLRKRMSRLANYVRSRVLNDRVRDSGCGMKIFRREVIDALLPIRTLYSFIPALAVGAGFSVAEQEVRHRARETGVSKYGLGVMFWRPCIDMLGVWWFMQRRFSTLQPAERR
jgi:glycosyltransferase involved in cell wall biosynthesis